MANIDEEKLEILQFTLGLYIRNKLDERTIREEWMIPIWLCQKMKI